MLWRNEIIRSGRVGVVLDDHLVTTQFWIDGKEEGIDAHVRVVLMDGAGDAAMKERQHFGQVDMTSETRALLISLVRRLTRFTVQLLVIIDFEPRGEQSVHFVKIQDFTGADFSLQLPPQGPKATLDQAAGGWVSHRSMKQLGIQLGAGQFQRIGVINRGVVDIEVAAGAVLPQARRSESRSLSRFSSV